jgi:hypothetical protein
MWVGASPSFAAVWHLATSNREARIAHHLKKGNFHD